MKSCKPNAIHTLRSFLLFLLSALCILISSSGIAQSPISEYLDDGEFYEKKNILKVNASSLIIGNLPILYERAVSPFISVEAGAGIILPWYVNELSQLFIHEPIITKPTGGYSFSGELRFFPFTEAPEEFYMGLLYRHRDYKQDDQRIIFTDIVMNTGRQVPVGEVLMLEYGWGIGFRFIAAPDIVTEAMDEFDSFQLVISVNLKLGFKF